MRRPERTFVPVLAVLALTAAAAEEPLAVSAPLSWQERIHLEAHGFVSFGYLRTWGNDWVGDGDGGSTEEGTDDFWEAGANVIARPLPRLRVGIQLFARDLGRYDNGEVAIDWAQATYTFSDEVALTAGRFKFPVGLYNEVIDVDAARVPVFLPPVIYGFRSRDLYISADGGKLDGYLFDRVEFSLYAGAKRFDSEAGLTTFFTEFLGADVGSVRCSTDAIVGGMVHVHDLMPGLGARLTLTDLVGFRVDGTLFGAPFSLGADHYIQGVASLLYEAGDWEATLEYSRLYARGDLVAPALAYTDEVRDDSHALVLATTWHARSWIDCYAAVEAASSSAIHHDTKEITTLVGAVRLQVLPNWSVKVEGRHSIGDEGLNDQPDGEPTEGHWQALILKTTVDF